MADRLYDYTNSREGSHQGQLFFGNKTSKVSAEDLRAEFESESNAQLRSAFGSFDNYLGYMDERQDLIDSGSLKADWWDTGDPLLNPETGYEIINEGDPNVDYKEQMMVQSAGGYNSQSAMHDLYTKYTGQDITEARSNENGDNYRWNGTSYVKTFTNDGGFAKDFTLALMTAAIGSAASPLLAAKLGGGKLAAGVSAGAVNAGTQAVLTGEIDPKKVLAAGVIGGINPGGTVADKYAPWKNADGEWAFGGAPPSSFYGGLVSGTVNDVVSTGLTEGEIDLQKSLEAGLVSGGVNAALNTYDEWKNNSQEAIADRLQFQDPYKYPNTEAGRAAAMAAALEDPLLNTTDFGAIIGDDGLLPFIPRADLGFLRGITDPVGDVIDGVLNGFELGDVMVLSDGTRIPMEGMTDAEYQNYTLNQGGQVYGRNTVGLLNNPVVNGAAELLSGLLPSGGVELNENLQSQKDEFGAEWDTLYADEYQLLDKNGLPTGQLTVAGQAAKNDFIQLKMDTLGSFYFENSGGLNENYSWSENPRGVSELWGTMTGIPGLYSTGGQNSWLPSGDPGVVTPPLNPDGTPVTPILNLNGEIDPVGYAEYVASLDPSSAVLPSNDEAALRNWWVQQYYDYLNQNGANGANGGDASVDLGVNTGVIPDTATTDTNTDGRNVATTTGGDVTTDTGGDVTVDTGGDVTTDTGGDTSTNNTVDTGNNSTPANNVTPIYGLPINDNGTVTLPGGATVSENIADNVYKQMYGDNELGGSDSTQPTQPGSGTLPSNNLNFGGKDNLPLLWTELFGYTKISSYKKARLKVLEGMLSGMQGGGVGNMDALEFGANRDPYQKIGRSLIDAGMEPKG